MSKDWPQRQKPAHGVKIKTLGPTIVFVTVCTKDRRPVLATDQVHTLLVEQFQRASAWQVGRYVVMPDHIHLFASPIASIPLDNWVRYWKSQFTKIHGEAIWQTDHWDTRLRGDESYRQKWEYVRNNPVRHRLVSLADDWAYQGELNVLTWHGPS